MEYYGRKTSIIKTSAITTYERIMFLKNPDTQAFNCPKWPSTDNSSGVDKGALSGGDCPYTSGLDGQG